MCHTQIATFDQHFPAFNIANTTTKTLTQNSYLLAVFPLLSSWCLNSLFYFSFFLYELCVALEIDDYYHTTQLPLSRYICWFRFDFSPFGIVVISWAPLSFALALIFIYLWGGGAILCVVLSVRLRIYHQVTCQIQLISRISLEKPREKSWESKQCFFIPFWFPRMKFDENEKSLWIGSHFIDLIPNPPPTLPMENERYCYYNTLRYFRRLEVFFGLLILGPSSHFTQSNKFHSFADQRLKFTASHTILLCVLECIEWDDTHKKKDIFLKSKTEIKLRETLFRSAFTKLSRALLVMNAKSDFLFLWHLNYRFCFSVAFRCV